MHTICYIVIRTDLLSRTFLYLVWVCWTWGGTSNLCSTAAVSDLFSALPCCCLSLISLRSLWYAVFSCMSDVRLSVLVYDVPRSVWWNQSSPSLLSPSFELILAELRMAFAKCEHGLCLLGKMAYLPSGLKEIISFSPDGREAVL